VPTEPAEEPLPRTTRRHTTRLPGLETAIREYDGDRGILRPAAVAGLAQVSFARSPRHDVCRRDPDAAAAAPITDIDAQLAVADLDVSGDTSMARSTGFLEFFLSRPVGQGPGSAAACSTSSRSRGGDPRRSRAPPLTGLLPIARPPQPTQPACPRATRARNSGTRASPAARSRANASASASIRPVGAA
jgi:hypothetical protein